jgi:hypothetical protein
VANVTAHADMKVIVSILRVEKDLDDGILVEVAPDQVGDVALGPRLQPGVFVGAEVQDEVGEVPPPVEAAVERGRDLSAVVVAMKWTERINTMPVESGAVLADDVLGPTGTGRLMIFQADEIVGVVNYNTHGSFVARQE